MRKFYLVLGVACVISGCKPPRHRGGLHTEPPPTPVGNGGVVIAEDQSGRRQEAKVQVAEIPNPPPIPSIPPVRDKKPLDSEVKDAYFAYDRNDLLPEARLVLEDDAAILKSILMESPGVVLAMEGHCDERGSAEYNLALGDLRARTARDFLLERGVSAGQLDVISYGKERPQCTAQEESCWQKNRRAHIAAK